MSLSDLIQQINSALGSNNITNLEAYLKSLSNEDRQNMSNVLLASVHGTDFGTAIAESDISNLIGISEKPNEGIDFDFDIEGKEWPVGMNDYWHSSVRSLFNSIQNLTNNNQVFLND